MAVTRSVDIKLDPAELAELFCGMFGNEQAKFFDHIHKIARDWPGAGWCQQSCDIARHLTADGREVVRTFAAHALNRDDL